MKKPFNLESFNLEPFNPESLTMRRLTLDPVSHSLQFEFEQMMISLGFNKGMFAINKSGIAYLNLNVNRIWKEFQKQESAMKTEITREEYEEIQHSTDEVVIKKTSNWKKKTTVVKVFIDGKVVAIKEVTGHGTTHYKVS